LNELRYRRTAQFRLNNKKTNKPLTKRRLTKRWSWLTQLTCVLFSLLTRFRRRKRQFAADKTESRDGWKLGHGEKDSSQRIRRKVETDENSAMEKETVRSG